MEVFIFKTWSPTNSTDMSHHLLGYFPPQKKSTDISKLIVRVCIDNKLINQKFKWLT